jgi:CDGSH-type Zn-finger protein/uncharacterized Fe-S cluster protein YjdI
MSGRTQEYRGEKITVRFDERKCIHSRTCVLSLPGVFVANAEGPWIQPDNAAVETIAAVAHGCPSGAITYERHDGGPTETAPEINVIRVLENGPLAVRAELRIAGQPPTHRATLCRCGASKNKPFCDGSHGAVRFQATGEPAAGAVEALEARGGALEITPFPDGPLGVKGNVEICAGSGRPVARTRSTALCRCGHSANKPYCDGSHRAAGFRAP